MVDKTIPNLDAVTTPAATDVFPCRQSGDTEDRKQTRLQLHILQSGETFTGSNSNAPVLDNLASADVIPNIRPNKADINTGIGSRSGDELALIAGGREGIRLMEISNGVIQHHHAQLTITANPGGGQGGAFGLLDSYNRISVCATLGDSVRLPPTFFINAIIYIKNDGAAQLALFPASGDDLGAGVNASVNIQPGEALSFIATATNATWTQLLPSDIPSELLANNAAGPAIVDEAATSTNPTLIPNQVDLDTGVAWNGSDVLALIAGAIAGIQLTELNNQVIPSYDVQLNLTAFATGGQGSAVQLNAPYCTVTVVGTNGDSVKLPPVFKTGAIIEVKNDDAAQNMDVFPASGDDLGAGTDTAISVAFGASAKFLATAANATWTTLRNA